MRETRRKWLCLALASILLMTLSLPPAKATETLVAEDANAYTPVEAQNLLTAKDTGHAYSPFPEEEAECGKPTPEYVPGEAIYARTGGASLLGADDSALAALGVSESEAIYATGTESARLMGASEEIIWYKAKVAGSVPETVAALKELDGIVDAEPNYVYKTEAVGRPSAAETEKSWFMEDGPGGIGLRAGWESAIARSGAAPGAGTVVAVLDTGVDYEHEDLRESLWTNDGEIPGNGADDDGNGYIDDYYGINATQNPKRDGAAAGNPWDDNGHGTHVAGIIAMANNGIGGVGVAWGAKIMSVKVGNYKGEFAASDVAQGIEYAVSMGADVINMSFGSSASSSLVAQALQDALPYCVPVAAAGNNGLPTTDYPFSNYPYRHVDFMAPPENTYPAAYSYVLGVMATDKSGNLADFSNWDYLSGTNAEYEIAAPGAEIYSALPGNRYEAWSGTSMAAPIVSAAAAILRGLNPDKTEYTTRTLMGQLASASSLEARMYRKAMPWVQHLRYSRLDLSGETQYPKPRVTLSQGFTLDNVRDGTVNDGDRVIDAGEVIDLAVSVRNQSGLTGPIEVSAEAVSGEDFVSPFVEFLTDTVTLDPAGAFSTTDNGWIYDGDLIVDVSNPIRFRVSENVPNDTPIEIRLAVRTTNGLDENDTQEYASQASFSFRVQRGTRFGGTLKPGVTTLTADKYWMIGSLSIPADSVLNVEPGAQIELSEQGYIRVFGELNLLGTEDAPIQMFPNYKFYSEKSAFFKIYIASTPGIVPEEKKVGKVTFRYCKIRNLSSVDHDWVPPVPFDATLQEADHCDFYYDADFQLSSGASYYNVSPAFQKASFCRFHYAESGNNNYLNVNRGSHNLYDIHSNINIPKHKHRNCVFLSGSLSQKGTIPMDGSVPRSISGFFSPPFTWSGASSKYVIMDSSPLTNLDREQLIEGARAAASTLNGTLLKINSKAEAQGVTTAIERMIQNGSIKGENRKITGTTILLDSIYMDCKCIQDADENSFLLWEDGTKYSLNEHYNARVYFDEQAFPGETVEASIERVEGQIGRGTYMRFGKREFCKRFILEIPASYSDEAITETLNRFYEEQEYLTPWFYQCAILNPLLNQRKWTWISFVMDERLNDGYYTPLYGNYWGTENSRTINELITDDADNPMIYGDLDENPILTLSSPELATIYPFVTRVWITEPDGDAELSEADAGRAYEAHVAYNRDMDDTLSPVVTLGGEYPFSDYAVNAGRWFSKREWVGSFKLPSATSGKMYFRVSGGRADDDHWLVCGTDESRFQFQAFSAVAQSMALSAVGEPGQVRLSWQRSDYDTLAGYNLYRSENNGAYRRLNDSILTDVSYTDKDVRAGATYTYYCAVVDTNGTETDWRSDPAGASPTDASAPVITHTPVSAAEPGKAVTISASVSDNQDALSGVTLYYRDGSSDYAAVRMTYVSATGLYTARIPAAAVTEYGVWYYVEAADEDGNLARDGSPAAPHVIRTGNGPMITAARLSRQSGETEMRISSAKAGSYLMAVALYSSNGQMLSVRLTNTELSDGESAVSVSFSGDDKLSKADSVRVFLLTEDLVPVSGCFQGAVSE